MELKRFMLVCTHTQTFNEHVYVCMCAYQYKARQYEANISKAKKTTKTYKRKHMSTIPWLITLIARLASRFVRLRSPPQVPRSTARPLPCADHLIHMYIHSFIFAEQKIKIMIQSAAVKKIIIKFRKQANNRKSSLISLPCIPPVCVCAGATLSV